MGKNMVYMMTKMYNKMKYKDERDLKFYRKQKHDLTSIIISTPSEIGMLKVRHTCIAKQNDYSGMHAQENTPPTSLSTIQIYHHESQPGMLQWKCIRLNICDN
jgi:hypothetical protein